MKEWLILITNLAKLAAWIWLICELSAFNRRFG